MICNECNKSKNVSVIVGIMLCEECYNGVLVSETDHDSHVGALGKELYELQSIHSDVYKDWCGSRPRIAYDSYTVAGWNAELDMLSKWNDEAYEEQKVEQALAVKEFEQNITNLINMGAGDRVTALRWIEEAEGDDMYGHSTIEYNNNLPYGYLKAA